MTVTVAEAPANLPDLLAALRPGETLTLTDAPGGRPVAALTAAPPAPPGPNVAVLRELEEIWALRPKTPSPIRDEHLREVRSGGARGDNE